MNGIAFFSGGKDGLYAIYLSQRLGIDVKYLLLLKTTIGISPHYENIESLKKISKSMKKEMIVFDMKDGSDELVRLIKSYDVSYLIGGDIYLEDHLKWIKSIADKSHIKAFEPLWNINSHEISKKMIEDGFIYTIIAVDKKKLSKDYLGYTFKSLADLEKFTKQNSIDPAGEGGEFHTLVFESPLFDVNFNSKNSQLCESDRYFYLKVNLEAEK